jgi:hypothetical protein
MKIGIKRHCINVIVFVLLLRKYAYTLFIVGKIALIIQKKLSGNFKLTILFAAF